jgi:hypothetical protein
MRIEGYIDHPNLKITIMKMNSRYIVKFENLGLEQSYKFNESENLSGMKDIKQIIDESFMQQVESMFLTMSRLKLNTLDKIIEKGGETFPNII